MSKLNPTPQEKYDRENRVAVQFRLNRKTDADILDWLERQPSKQGAVKDLIRREIAGEHWYD